PPAFRPRADRRPDEPGRRHKALAPDAAPAGQDRRRRRGPPHGDPGPLPPPADDRAGGGLPAGRQGGRRLVLRLRAAGARPPTPRPPTRGEGAGPGTGLLPHARSPSRKEQRDGDVGHRTRPGSVRNRDLPAGSLSLDVRRSDRTGSPPDGGARRGRPAPYGPS